MYDRKCAFRVTPPMSDHHISVLELLRPLKRKLRLFAAKKHSPKYK